MKLEKRKGFDLGPMLKRLSKSRTVNPDGSSSLPIGTSFATMDTYESYFRTAVYVDGKSEAFIGRVIRKAMSAEQTLTDDEFIKQARSIAHQLDRNERKPMKVVFPIWAHEGLLVGKCQWGGVRINFNTSAKSRFVRRAQAERAEQVQNHKRHTVLGDFDNSDLPLAVCTVDAIDAYDAFELAEKAITVELGLYSLMDYRAQKIFSIPSYTLPISNALLAPHMTVHELSGKLAVDQFWSNPWAGGQGKAPTASGKAEEIREAIEAYRKKIHKLPWRSLAEDALSRHYEAYGQKDMAAAFLDGWRLLETIGGAQYEQGDKLVKRAAWFFEDASESYQFGLHLKARRNLISHGQPVGGQDDELLAFQMKEFFTPMFRSLLCNPFGFKDIEEFWDFCDLPVCENERITKNNALKKQLRLLKYGAECRGDK